MNLRPLPPETPPCPISLEATPLSVYLIHMQSRDVIRELEQAGWRLKRVAGSHHHFTHPTRPGLVTVPHPVNDLKIGTLKSIERQSGVKLR